MKRLFLLLLLLQLMGAFASAQISVKKSVLLPPKTDEFQSAVQIVLNTNTGQSLVAWAGVIGTHSAGIHGRMVDAQGKTLKGEIILADEPEAIRPSIAYNPVMNEFLLAYDNNVNSMDPTSSIFVKRLNANGKPIGKAINITDAAGSADLFNVLPKVAFNPKTGSYTVIWIRTDSAVAVLLKDGTTVNSPVVTIASDLPIPLDAVAMPSADKLLVLFRQFVGEQSGLSAENDYLLATLDPLLKNVKSSDTVRVNNVRVKRNRGRFNFEGDLVISDQTALVFYVATEGVKRRKINSKGKLSGPSLNAFHAPKANTPMFDPSAGFSTTSKGTRGILIAVEDSEPPGTALTWAQVLDAKGTPIGDPVQVDTTSAEKTMVGGRINALPGLPTDTIFRYFWCASLTEDLFSDATGTHSGIMKLNLILSQP